MLDEAWLPLSESALAVESAHAVRASANMADTATTPSFGNTFIPIRPFIRFQIKRNPTWSAFFAQQTQMETHWEGSYPRSRRFVASYARTYQSSLSGCPVAGSSRRCSRKSCVSRPPRRTSKRAVRLPWCMGPNPLDATTSSMRKARQSRITTMHGSRLPSARKRARTSTDSRCTRLISPSLTL